MNSYLNYSDYCSLPYVYCLIINNKQPGKIAIIIEKKSGLYGIPKERIWDDEKMTPKEKADNILKKYTENKYTPKIFYLHRKNSIEYVVLYTIDSDLNENAKWVNTEQVFDENCNSSYNSSYKKVQKILKDGVLL